MFRHIVFTESSPNVGGQELQLIQQMLALREQGIATTLACRPGGTVEQAARARGVDTVAVAFRNSAHLPSILRLRRLLRETQASAVICHSGHDANNVALAARLLAHRPVILRSRTYLTGGQKPFSYNVLVDATMVPSRFMKDALLATPGIRADRIHVVYPGIDFDAIDRGADAPLPRPVERWLAAAAGPVILQSAMLRGEKGHLPMLQAFARLHAIYPDARYLIAGEGPERQAIEVQIAALGLTDAVMLAGNVSPAHGLYRCATLVVMPSLSEPLGMSQIEALALGVPVIASRVGGIPETVQDGVTGLLVPPGDVDAWADALLRALQDPVRMQTLAAAGCEAVRQRFSVAANTRGVLELIRRHDRKG